MLLGHPVIYAGVGPPNPSAEGPEPMLYGDRCLAGKMAEGRSQTPRDTPWRPPSEAIKVH